MKHPLKGKLSILPVALTKQVIYSRNTGDFVFILVTREGHTAEYFKMSPALQVYL